MRYRNLRARRPAERPLSGPCAAGASQRQSACSGTSQQPRAGAQARRPEPDRGPDLRLSGRGAEEMRDGARYHAEQVDYRATYGGERCRCLKCHIDNKRYQGPDQPGGAESYHWRVPSPLRPDQLPVMVPAPRTDIGRRRRAIQGAPGQAWPKLGLILTPAYNAGKRPILFSGASRTLAAVSGNKPIMAAMPAAICGVP